MNIEERKRIQKQYTEKIVDYLPTFRSVAKITGNQLAKKLGVTRSTMVVIESRIRTLQWHTYLSIVLVFMQNEDSKKRWKTSVCLTNHYLLKSSEKEVNV